MMTEPFFEKPELHWPELNSEQTQKAGRMARLSLILGLIGIFLCAGFGIGSFIGMALGMNALPHLNQKDQSGQAEIAKTGFALNFACLILWLIIFTFLPGVLSARRSANEGSTKASLRAIHAAQMRHAENRNGKFADDLGALDLDPAIREMATKEKDGYRLGKMTVTAADGIHPARFSVTAEPVRPRGIFRTGRESYFLDETGTIRFVSAYENNGPATASSEPVRY